MKRFIRPTDDATPRDFGCEPSHFEKHIKNKVLTVTSALVHSLTVIDDEGESWYVDKVKTIETDSTGRPLKQLAHA